MKTFFYAFCILLLSCSIHKIQAQNYNQFDTLGKRHGQWRKTFKDTKILRFEGQFNHGKEIGTFKFYKNVKGEAVLAATRTYNENSEVAKVTFYNTKGQVISEGQMKGKTYIGNWKYYQNGTKQLLTQEHYDALGRLDGERLIYYKNGQVSEQNNYKAGERQGISNWYAQNGTLVKTYTYLNGKLHGPAKFYDIKGELITEGYYKNDKKRGTWKYYDKGTLLETKTF